MSKQPLAPTSHNIIVEWCRMKGKNPARLLKDDDAKQVIAFAVSIGASIGAQETLKVIDSKVNTTEDVAATYEPVEAVVNNDLSEK